MLDKYTTSGLLSELAGSWPSDEKYPGYPSATYLEREKITALLQAPKETLEKEERNRRGDVVRMHWKLQKHAKNYQFNYSTPSEHKEGIELLEKNLQGPTISDSVKTLTSTWENIPTSVKLIVGGLIVAFILGRCSVSHASEIPVPKTKPPRVSLQ
jgi:hypothetical protein